MSVCAFTILKIQLEKSYSQNWWAAIIKPKQQIKHVSPQFCFWCF